MIDFIIMIKDSGTVNSADSVFTAPFVLIFAVYMALHFLSGNCDEDIT